MHIIHNIVFLPILARAESLLPTSIRKYEHQWRPNTIQESTEVTVKGGTRDMCMCPKHEVRIPHLDVEPSLNSNSSINTENAITSRCLTAQRTARYTEQGRTTLPLHALVESTYVGAPYVDQIPPRAGIM